MLRGNIKRPGSKAAGSIHWARDHVLLALHPFSVLILSCAKTKLIARLVYAIKIPPLS
jgi:hypothetical protein